MPSSTDHATSAAALRQIIANEWPGLRDFRRDLHAHPELAYQEQRTSRRVQEELSKLGIAFKAGLAGGTGVVAHLPASDGSGGGAIGLRADMDALPIDEQTGVPYASRTPGVMHACGHDGHTAILLGAARVLSRVHRPRPVTLVFQPAEEGGGGADRLCQEGVLDGAVIGPKVERMYGLHGGPDYALGTVASRPGPLLASTDEIDITVRGVQCHGAYPHYGRDAITAAGHIIVALQTVVSRNVGPSDSVVVSLGMIHAGSATNVIPERVHMMGTIRSLTPQTRELARRRVREIAENTARALGCEADVTLDEGYPVTFNDPGQTDAWFDLARRTLGPERVVLVAHPTMGGEDFSYYARRVPAVFFWLGLKRPAQDRFPTLHQPDFDFNDDAIPTGVEMFVRLAGVPAG
jgi:amidohydrolase